MKLRTEFEPDPKKEPDWPEGAIFEYDRFGSKIMVWPRREVWVRECIEGRVIRKEFAVPFRRDRENFYYLERGATPPEDDSSGNLIPSRWEENN